MKYRLLYGLKVLLCALLLLIASSQIYAPERNNAANSLYSQQDYVGALDAYQLAQVNAPNQWEYYYNAASALTATGRLRAAVEALEQALKVDTDALKTQAYYNLGHVYYQLGRYDDAVEAFQQVLRYTPDDADARYNYELALAHQVPTPTPQEQQTNPEEDETNPESTPTSNPADQDESAVTPTLTPTPTITFTPTSTSTPPPDDSSQSPPGDISTPNSGEPDTAENNENDENATLIPAPNSPLSLSDVEQQFDAIQDAQLTLREALENFATPERSNEKDW